MPMMPKESRFAVFFSFLVLPYLTEGANAQGFRVIVYKCTLVCYLLGLLVRLVWLVLKGVEYIYIT